MEQAAPDEAAPPAAAPDEPVPPAAADEAPASDGSTAAPPLTAMLEQLQQASSTSWQAANRALERHGFSPVPLDGETPDASAAAAAILKLCEQHEARGRTLERAVVEVDQLAQRDPGAPSIRAAQYEKSIAALQSQLDSARADNARQTRYASETVKAAELTVRQLKQKVAAQAGQLRQREAEAQRMQERLAKVPEREAARRERERQVFAEAHRRAARPSSASDSRTLELISAYEAHQTRLSMELENMRDECRRLAAEVRERDNLIARKDSFRSWRTPTEGELRGRLAQAEEALAQQTLAVNEAEERGEEKARELAAKLQEAQRKIAVADERAEAALLEAEGRPSLAQWAGAQATIAELRAEKGGATDKGFGKGAWSQPAREGGDGAPAAAPAGAEGGGAAATAAAIRRDRELHELGLQSVRALQADQMVTLIQDSCLELQLAEATQLPASLRKVRLALSALPKMEAFIRDVCALVLYESPPGGARTDRPRAPGAPQEVLEALRNWAVQLREWRSLQDFMLALSRQLRNRATQEDSGTGPIGVPLAPSELLEAVRELVANERRSLRAIDNFEQADLRVERNAEAGELLAKLLKHFQKLFDVRDGTAGVLPKMNELYLHTHELQNFMQVLRTMLGLEPTATIHTILSTVRRMSERAAGTGGGEAAEATGGAATEGGDAVGGGGGGSGEGGKKDPTGADAMPQYVAITAELRKKLQASSVFDLPAVTERLLAELRQHRTQQPQMKALIQQLCTTLAVANADELVPAVLQLQSLSEHAGALARSGVVPTAFAGAEKGKK